MKYDKLTTLRLDPNKYEALKQLADKKETSVGSLIRQAISQYLRDNTN